MNISNNLYNLSLNLKTTKKEKEKKEEKKAEVKPEVSAKVPEEKKITASVADIFAEMNKSLVKGPGAPKTTTRAEENGIDVAQLISEYNNQKRTLLMNKITVPSAEQLETAQELLELATRIKGLRPNESTSSADIDTTNWDANWQREIDYWTDFLENNGGRSIEEEGVDRTMRAGREYTLNTSELSEKAHQLWTRVLELLNQYHIEYDTTISFEATYEEETWQNGEFVKPFMELGNVLNDAELEEIRRMVTDILRLFEGGTFDNSSDLGKFSKHALQYGIIACLLDPNGINPHILH